MRRTSRLGTCCAALALSAASAGAGEPWEGRPLSPEQRAACRTLPRALVRAVTPARRAEAAALLGAAQAVALDEVQAAAWIGVDAPRSGSLADRLLKDATDALMDRRASSIGEHALKWSAAEQLALDDLLEAVATSHAALKPVLVRAVTGGEAEGRFDAAACGDGLAVRHRSRGPWAGPPEPEPVIVFLEQAPVAVQAWREAAP